MSEAFRAVFRRLHHAPWVCAAIILAAGVTNWAMFPPKEAPAPEEPQEQAAGFISPEAFRQVVMPAEQADGSTPWMDQPFSIEPAPPAEEAPFPVADPTAQSAPQKDSR
jgi:hypothetical protein